MLKLICIALTLVAVYAGEPKHWALIVAGSQGWGNYRHQADACHAYQIVKKNGIPDERVIVMMYDDIAKNRQNPTPGKIINRPNGPDVYHGVPKDYTGLEVTPDNFLMVLTGDEEGLRAKGLKGKVIKSGPNDHIFVNFADHGAPGILAFPNEFLHASALHSAVMDMHKNKKYGKMVFYIEACESGSMFYDDLLPKDINVYATTAANPQESSYACYFDQERGTYLGDVYSVNWMEDSDREDLKTETLLKQFKIVKEETNTSHCQEYGDLTMGDLDVDEFQGKSRTGAVFDRRRGPRQNPNLDAVRSEDVPLAILYRKASMAHTAEEKSAYIEQARELEINREEVYAFMKHVVGFSVNHSNIKTKAIMTMKRPLTRHDCYVPVVEGLKEICPGLNVVQNDFALRHLYVLVNLCEEPVSVDTIREAMEKVAVTSSLCF